MTLKHDQFYLYVKKGIFLSDESDLELNPTPGPKMLMDKISNEIKSHHFDISNDDESDDFVEMTSCKYYRVDEYKKEKFSDSNSFSVLHLNIHSMERHIVEFQLQFDLLKF